MALLPSWPWKTELVWKSQNSSTAWGPSPVKEKNEAFTTRWVKRGKESTPGDELNGINHQQILTHQPRCASVLISLLISLIRGYWNSPQKGQVDLPMACLLSEPWILRIWLCLMDVHNRCPIRMWVELAPHLPLHCPWSRYVLNRCLWNEWINVMRAAFDLAVKGIPTQEALKKNLQEIKILNL